MRKIIILAAFFALVSIPAKACLNESTVTKDGKTNIYEIRIETFYRSFNVPYYQSLIDTFEVDNLEKYDFKQLSDLAVYYTKTGKTQEAFDILVDLNKKHPNEYLITANLGTVYELMGEVDSAYKYISEAIRLNPDSHYGSEWYHISVLEAKQKMRTDPDWVKNNKVLNIAQKREESKPKEGDLGLDIYTITWQISHQLRERIPFTKEPDIILANTLVEYGDMLAEEISINNAYVAYYMAEYYDPENIFKAREKRIKTAELLDKYREEHKDDNDMIIMTEEELKAHFPDIDIYQDMGDVHFVKKENKKEPEVKEVVKAKVAEVMAKVAGNSTDSTWVLSVIVMFCILYFGMLTLTKDLKS